MTYSTLLVQTCQISRYVEGAADAYGNPAKTWVVRFASVPCRQVYGKGREILVGAEVIIIYDELFLEDVDVDTWDRVVISGKTYDIVNVVVRQDAVIGPHHKHCFLQRVDNG
jgi:hypothetical protein